MPLLFSNYVREPVVISSLSLAYLFDCEGTSNICLSKFPKLWEIVGHYLCQLLHKQYFLWCLELPTYNPIISYVIQKTSDQFCTNVFT